MKKKPAMIRTTIYLPDDIHRGMKMMAAAEGQSMADLLREALVQVYKEDLADIHAANEAMKEHRKNPSSDISYREYRARRR
jgi:predicted DNA-binding protein